MTQFKILTQLEIKRGLKALPHICIGTIILLAVVGCIGFCGDSILKNDNGNNEKAAIAVVVNDNSSLVTLAVSIATSQSKSTSLTCDFLFPTLEEANTMLEKNEITALMHVPKGFMSAFANNDIIPIEVTFSKDTGYGALIFHELANAIGNVLRSVQSGSLGIYDLYNDFKLSDKASKASNKFDTKLVGTALTRSKIYTPVNISSTGNMSSSEYYIASIIVIFALLWGIICSSYMQRYSVAMIRKLHSHNLNSIIQHLSKLVGILCTFISSLLCLIVIGKIITAFAKIDTPYLKLQPILFTLLSSLPAIILAMCIIILVYSIANNQMSGIIMLFISSTAMCFLSGCIVPTAFLPEIVDKIKFILPTTYMLNQVSNSLLGQFSLWNTIWTLVFAFVLFSLNVVIINHRLTQSHKNGGLYE